MLLKAIQTLKKSIRNIGTVPRSFTRKRVRPIAAEAAQIEHLEDRQLLWAGLSTVAFNGAYDLHITGHGNEHEQVFVHEISPTHILVQSFSHDVYGNYRPGPAATLPKASLEKIVFRGNWGNDVFQNNTSIDSIAYGGAGADTLYGGSGDDELHGDGDGDRLYGRDGDDLIKGGIGNDWLYGGDDNDKLYGGTGYNRVYGEDGHDFLDKGQSGFTSGGAGEDFHAHAWTRFGATFDDIVQGGGPSCWLVSAISSAQLRGENLHNRITYLGESQYRVGLYDADGNWSYETVFFDGDRADGRGPITMRNSGHDARPAAEGEFWTILMQRAYLQSRNLSRASTPSGWPTGPLEAFTGYKSQSWSVNPSSSFNWQDLARMDQAIDRGDNVVACTHDRTSDLDTDKLTRWHCYTVVDIEYDGTVPEGWRYWDSPDNWAVVLRNPWGFDIGSGGTPSGTNSDGIVRVSLTEFYGSFKGIVINSSTYGNANGTGSSGARTGSTAAETPVVSKADFDAVFSGLPRAPLAELQRAETTESPFAVSTEEQTAFPVVNVGREPLGESRGSSNKIVDTTKFSELPTTERYVARDEAFSNLDENLLDGLMQPA